MKKVLAILLVLCMAFALIACNKGDSSNSPAASSESAPAASSESSPAGNVPPDAGPKELGFYDRDYDYTQYKKFRFVYMVSNPGPMYDNFDRDWAMWADKINMEYAGMWAPATSGDNEAFLSGVETHADMGFDAILMDCDQSVGARAVEILNSRGIPWFQCMVEVRDMSSPYVINGEYQTGTRLGPGVSFNHYLMGVEMTNKLMDWKEETYPDVPWEEVGFIAVSFSTSPPLHARAQGAAKAWTDRLPQFGEYDAGLVNLPRNFVVADAAASTFDTLGATNLVTQVLSDPPDPNIKVWLIQAATWDQALGASIAAENLGLTDVTATTCMGSGDNGFALWDSGVPSTIRFTLESPFPVYAETIVNAVWAMCAGFVTSETLWPQWRNINDKGDVFQMGDMNQTYQAPNVVFGDDGKPIILEEHNYASMLLPCMWVGLDNWIEFGGWCDLYDFGPNATPEERKNPTYPLATDINQFDSRGAPPDYYFVYP